MMSIRLLVFDYNTVFQENSGREKVWLCLYPFTGEYFLPPHYLQSHPTGFFP